MNYICKYKIRNQLKGFFIRFLVYVYGCFASLSVHVRGQSVLDNLELQLQRHDPPHGGWESNLGSCDK